MNILFFELFHIIFNVFTIWGYNRTVKVVVCIFIFFTLVRYTWEKNKFNVLFYKPWYMTMNKLGRVALWFAWYWFYSKFVNFSVRRRWDYNTESQLCEKCMPEWIILIHIECSWYTYNASWCFIRRKRLIRKKSLIFVFIQIRKLVLVFFFPKTAFTSVAGYKLSASGKFIDCKETVVNTSLTSCHWCFVFKVNNLFKG